MSDNASTWESLRHRYLTRFRSRFIAGYEMFWSCRTSSSCIEVDLSGSRRLLRVEVYIRGAESTEIKHLKCLGEDGETNAPPIMTSTEVTDDITAFHIVLSKIVRAKSISIELDQQPELFDYRVRVLVVDEPHSDFELLRHARSLLETGENHLALQYLKDYQQINDTNPHAHHLLAFCNLQMKRADDAMEASLQAMGRGLVDECVEIYRSARGTKSDLPVEDIRRLQKESQSWRLPGGVGLVAVEKSQRFALGYGANYYSTTEEILEVKRPAAARMLRMLSFPVSAGTELLLHTQLRVIHRDDSIEEMPLERFRLTDADDKNLFIAVEDDKEGHWILPDLETGDLIVWSHDILGKCFATTKGSQFFKLTHPFDAVHPTWRGRVEFLVPPEIELNTSKWSWSDRFSIEQKDDGSRSVTSFSGTQVVPVKHTAFAYENNYLNPLVAVSSGDRAWTEVADYIMGRSFGDSEPEDDLPPPLAQIIAGSEDRIRRLETAFYWIRDKLKYASLKSAHEQIGTSQRAAKIVESGTADCKDRAYLMWLVCRELNYPCQYVFVSSKNGLVIKELPADQFDHVFVRVKTDRDWLYLDPTSTESAFDTTPFWCQGLYALVLDGSSQLELIPEDPPDRNVLAFHESIEEARDGWLEGGFDIVARGHIGRSLNELWKSLSLAVDDQQRAATESLRRYLPTSVATAYERISDTGSSTVFHINGHMRRCRLQSMRGGELVGSLSWSLPFLPVSYWRVLSLDRHFVFNFPCKVKLAVTFGPKITGRLTDFSRVTPHECDIGLVSERVESREDLLTVVRNIQINRRFITGDLTAGLPLMLDRVESALRLAVSLSSAERTENSVIEG